MPSSRFLVQSIQGLVKEGTAQIRMDAQSAVQALKLFNEKADKLERLSFTQKIFSEPSGVKIYWRQGEAFRNELVGPDEESREAMLLTLRFFVQDNEQSSFRNIAEAYNALPVDPSLSGEFHNIRKQVNEFLDSKTWIRVDGSDLTYRGNLRSVPVRLSCAREPGQEAKVRSLEEHPALLRTGRERFHLYARSDSAGNLLYPER